MRIISGSMRGTKLFTLDGLNTRPTLDRVKEPLFSILNFNLEDAEILDLFAGSGALGLESLSRGAKRAVLCDNSYEAIRVINQNIEKTKTQDKTLVVHKNYKNALEEFKNKNMQFNIIFLDPPYQFDYAEKATQMIVDMDLLKKDGIIVIETDTEEKVIQNLQNIDINMYDKRKYGRVTLLFLRKE